jgi:hypothetical protein
MSEKHELIKESGTLITQNDGTGSTKVEVTKVGTMVSHANTVNTTNVSNNRVVIVESAPTSASAPKETEVTMSRNYFSLFVLGRGDDLPYPTGSFFMPRDRLLETVYTRKEIIDLIRGFGDESLRRIRSYPALVCNENQRARKAEDNRMIYYGQIRDVHVQENGVWFDYLVLNAIPQNSINGIQGDLAIGSTTYFDEMMHTHWSIKQVDLVRVLRQAGFRVFSLS